MPESTLSPSTRAKRTGLLSGAFAYLGNGSKSKDKEDLKRVLSEPALQSPETPKSQRSKSTSSMNNIDERIESPPGETSAESQTPRAKQRVRRASLGIYSKHLSTEEAASVDGSTAAVTPPAKSRRRDLLGPMEVTKSPKSRRATVEASPSGRKPAGEKQKRTRSRDEDSKLRSISAGPRSKDHHRGDKEKPRKPSDGRIRSISAGPLDKPKRSHRTPGKSRRASISATDGMERAAGGAAGLTKTPRRTVGPDGKIRARSKNSEPNYNSDDSSAKRSKSSTKSHKSKKLKDKKRSKTLKDGERDDSGSHLRKNGRSNRHAELSSPSESSERRAGKRASSDMGSSSSLQVSALLEPVSENGRMSENPSTPIDSSTSSLPASIAEDEVTRLNRRLHELNEQNKRAQLASQAEIAKLRKELREEKLEHQRSQAERQDTRAELRERDLAVAESERRIKALEKAVESQLDKVDDLEEELRRANTEIFDLEGKLSGMEDVLAESSAIETTNLEKEKNFDHKRQERMERRLAEREKELEERERNLREERDSMLAKENPQREIEQLEQDNRMLLKALNREKAEAAEKLMQKIDEVEKLQKELKLAKMRSYSTLGSGNPDEGVAKLLNDNEDLQRRLDEEIERTSMALRQKDELIASLKQQMGNSNRANGGPPSSRNDDLMAQIELLKSDLMVTKSKLEAAQRRNQLLEDDIDHWKSINCNLEDELAEAKSQVVSWRVKYEDAALPHNDSNTYLSAPVSSGLQYSNAGGNSHATPSMLALGRRDDDDDHRSTISEPATSIANLWSKLTTPSGKRKMLSSNLDSSSVNEVISRTTFH